MKMKSNRIVFFGNERLATGVSTDTPTLNALLESNFEVVAVVANYTENSSRKTRELEIKSITDRKNIPLLLPDKLNQIKNDLKSLNATTAVLVAYGKIIPQEIIDLFPSGIINIHPSLLPKHRGPTPIESVILDGSTETGVSIMKLVKEMDAGPVYIQQKIELNGSDTKQELADRLGKLGAKLIVKHLPKILDKSLKPTAQDETNATYDRLITKLDGAIDWNMRAETIERQIRAYQNWPGSRAEIFGKDIIITEAKIINNTGVPGEVLIQKKQLVVCCGDQAIEILRLKPAGKAEMSAEAFLAGIKKH